MNGACPLIIGKEEEDVGGAFCNWFGRLAGNAAQQEK
jgi:hypothetical protein